MEAAVAIDQAEKRGLSRYFLAAIDLCPVSCRETTLVSHPGGLDLGSRADIEPTSFADQQIVIMFYDAGKK